MFLSNVRIWETVLNFWANIRRPFCLSWSCLPILCFYHVIVILGICFMSTKKSPFPGISRSRIEKKFRRKFKYISLWFYSTVTTDRCRMPRNPPNINQFCVIFLEQWATAIFKVMQHLFWVTRYIPMRCATDGQTHRQIHVSHKSIQFNSISLFLRSWIIIYRVKLQNS